MKKGIKTALCCGTVLLLVGGACIVKGAAVGGTLQMLGHNNGYFSIFPVGNVLRYARHWGNGFFADEIADELDDWLGLNSDIGRFVSRRVQREVRQEMRDALRDIEEDWDEDDDWDDSEDWEDWDDNDDWADDQDGTIPLVEVPNYEEDDIRKLELTVCGGTVMLTRGTDFKLNGSFRLTENDIGSYIWEVELSGEDGGATLVLPEDLTLDDIELNVERGGLVVKEPLSATHSIEISVETGTCLLDSIDSAVPELEIAVETGTLVGVLPYPHGELKAQVGHSPGAILLDGETLVGDDAKTYYSSPATDPSVSDNKIKLSVATGQINLSTEEQ